MRLGAQIRAMLQASETLQRPATAMELSLVAGLRHAPTNRTKLCQRAVSYGLMTVDADACPMQFRFVQGWQRIVKRDKPLKPVVQIDIRGIRNSVFSI